MIVAEQVAAALDGGLVTNAVNIPSIGRGGSRGARPVPPARGQARPLRARARPRRAERRITLEYYGELAEHDTRLLTVAALNGAFRGRVDQPVNYVNAPLIAAERGIEVVEQRQPLLARLHEPDRRLGRRAARRRHDDRPRQPPVARLGARLRGRDRARAADGRPPLRRRPRRDRPGRDAARRGRA